MALKKPFLKLAPARRLLRAWAINDWKSYRWFKEFLDELLPSNPSNYYKITEPEKWKSVPHFFSRAPFYPGYPPKTLDPSSVKGKRKQVQGKWKWSYGPDTLKELLVFFKALGIRSHKIYKEFLLLGIEGIPKNIALKYSTDKDWPGSITKFWELLEIKPMILDYEPWRNDVRKSGLTEECFYKKLRLELGKELIWPESPQYHFGKTDEWKGWFKVFVGTYDEVRERIKPFKLTSHAEYDEKRKQCPKLHLPGYPPYVFKKEWKEWWDFLGWESHEEMLEARRKKHASIVIKITDSQTHTPLKWAS